MDLEAVIGLEVHVQLKTRSKMFCSCANIFGDVAPNLAVCPICLGHPGTLPMPNQTAIQWTQLAGLALQCQLANRSKFDRKSYFYPDLPKGYQISQYDQPFCGPGRVTINGEDAERTIGITRIHLEEDAAKNIHPPGANYTLVDYNRAGTPLIEIVTEPDLRSPQEAKIFLQELQRIMRTLDISDADMEKGQLRCDANISLRKAGDRALHPKTEIKNLNSFRFVERALQYEIERQTDLWQKGDIPAHTTRGFDAEAQKTVAQRTKEEAADYRYFPEPDIPPFVFSEKEFEVLRRHVPELPAAKRQRLMRQYNLSADQVHLLTVRDDLANFFEQTVSEMQQMEQEYVEINEGEIPALVTLAYNILLRQFRQLLITNRLTADQASITPENFAELIYLVHQGRITKGAVEQVLAEMQRSGGDPDAIIQNLGLEQVSATADVETLVTEVIAENPEVVEKVRAGKESALQFLMGQVMAKSQGKANPQVVIEFLQKQLGK